MVNMKLNEYQELAGRTANPHENALLNYGLGLGGESGEVQELIKKFAFHGHVIQKDSIKNELGDVLWYLSNIAKTAGLTLEEIATANIEKLRKRYPEGFSVEDSIKRVDVHD